MLLTTQATGPSYTFAGRERREERSNLEESTVNRGCLVILRDRNKAFQGNPAPKRLRNEWKRGKLKTKFAKREQGG